MLREKGKSVSSTVRPEVTSSLSIRDKEYFKIEKEMSMTQPGGKEGTWKGGRGQERAAKRGRAGGCRSPLRDLAYQKKGTGHLPAEKNPHCRGKGGSLQLRASQKARFAPEKD